MDVRTHILKVATRRFARQGFDSTSLQEIADDVGVKKPSLLHHFPSKNELLRGVLDVLFEHWTEVLPRLLEAVTSGRARFFEAITAELITFFSEDPDRARLVVRELLDRPQQMQGRLAQTLTPWVTLIADYIRKSQLNGQVAEGVDPEVYILHVVTLTVSAIAAFPVVGQALHGSKEEVAERHIRELSRIARASLFARAPQGEPAPAPTGQPRDQRSE
ncbi:MAG: Transcriptional regulator, TetR family protein [Myxococcaceae bacterium]|nr:Transcriptional regulator, TetR family protein [Myxococcaceae bacterium]